MDIQDLRAEIDAIDDELVALFVRRMAVSGQVAQYKQAHGLPIYVPSREQEKLWDVAAKAGPIFSECTQALYSKIFELSRSHQELVMHSDAEVV